ncbi:MAG: inositol monophosphatase [Haloarculaceae archaeon]
MSDAARRSAIAERAARAGGVVARDLFRGDFAVETKAHRNDLVTDADHEAQEQVLSTLAAEFSTDTYVCEEADQTDGSIPGVGAVAFADEVPDHGDAWVVDPVDGTANFARGIRFWATSVTAVVDGQPVGTATYLPAERDVYTAGPDSVTLNGSALAVSERSDLATFAATLVGWWPTEEGPRTTALYRTAAESFGDVRRFGCMQGVLALVAAGSLDAAFMPSQPKPWDALGGVYLIRRAGGVATDLEGEPWHLDSDGLVVSNGLAHDSVLAAVSQAATSGAVD